MGAGSNNNITLGNGANDEVSNGQYQVPPGSHNTITLGNGNGDLVNDLGSNETITLGSGADTVTATSSLINGGNGHDSFVFTGTPITGRPRTEPDGANREFMFQQRARRAPHRLLTIPEAG